MRKLFSTRLHGVLDYLSVVALFLVPRLMNWDERLVQIGTVAAIAVLLNGLLTRYELGLFKAIPMRAHLAVDLLLGLAFLGMAFFLDGIDGTQRIVLGAFGLFTVFAGLATDTEPGLRREPAVAGETAASGNARSYPS